MRSLTPTELAAWLADTSRPAPLLLDVRESWEVELCAIAGSRHLPMAAVPPRVNELDPGQATVVICHHGGRSAQVAYFLERSGFNDIYNLSGGINAWSQAVDPTLPCY